MKDIAILDLETVQKITHNLNIDLTDYYNHIKVKYNGEEIEIDKDKLFEFLKGLKK